MTGSDFSEITKSTPEKSLVVSLKKNAGRNNQGCLLYTSRFTVMRWQSMREYWLLPI